VPRKCNLDFENAGKFFSRRVNTTFGGVIYNLRLSGTVGYKRDRAFRCNIEVALWPWGDSASNRNEYHEHFLGVKVAGA